MPFAVVGAVIAGAVGAAATAVGTFAFGATVLGLAGWAAVGASFAIGFVGSLLMSGASALLASSSEPRAIPFGGEASARTQMIRSPIASRKIVVGEVVCSGALVFAAAHGLANGQTPSGDNPNRDELVLVIVMAGHEIAEFGETWFNDKLAQSPQYTNLVTREHHLGAADQAASTLLQGYNLGWAAAHRLRGLAYLVVNLHFDIDAFSSGIPNVKSRLRGLKPVDPRDGTAYWSDNVAAVLRWYAMASEEDGGLASAADEVDGGSFIAAANTGDEMIAVPEVSAGVSADPASDLIVLSPNVVPLRTGDKIRFTTNGTPPGGLSGGGEYYWREYLNQSLSTDSQRGSLATSLRNARTGAVIDITTAGSGNHAITRIAQPRYTANGVIDTAKAPAQILDQLMTADAGVMVYQQGQYRHYAGAATSPTFALTESDLAGPLQVQPRQAKADLCNAVKGTFVDPAKSWQPSDFPAVLNPLYETQDGGERIYRDVELPFTTDAVMAQRLAKIVLEAMRQGATLRFPCKLWPGIAIAVRDVGTVTLPLLGYAAKEFWCTGWTLVDGRVDLELREWADEVFDWAEGDATTIDPAPDTNLPDPATVAATAIAGFAEALVATRSGAGVATELTVTWAAAPDAFVSAYALQYREAGETTWISVPLTGDTTKIIPDIADGAYEFRVKAINTRGVSSDWSPIAAYTVTGLSARPADVSGFTIVPLQGHALFKWDRHPDLDVRIGGRIRILWTQDTVAADEATAIDVFPGTGTGGRGGVPGGATEASGPLLSGTYFARAIDSSGNVSLEPAIVITQLPDLIHMNALVAVEESPGFAGAMDNVVLVDGGIQIDAAGNVDEIADVDAVADWDYNGGVSSEGTYTFADPVDLGAVLTARVTINIAMIAFSQVDLVDSWGPIDERPDIDGDPVDALGNVVVEVRTTQDDPGGTPTWSAWTPLIVGNYRARGFDFRARLQSFDVSVNVRVTELGATVDAPDRTEAGSSTSSSSADTTVTFALAFFVPPKVAITLQSAAAGDYVDLVSQNATGFTYSVRNGAGARIVRAIDWLARGYGDI